MVRISIALIFIGFLFFSSFQAFAQQDSVKAPKRFRFTPLPVIYYSPETKLGFGALMAASFETVKVPDKMTTTSYAQMYFLYTQQKQYDFGVKTRVYLPQNKTILQAKFNYTYFPEYYFGIENEDPLSRKDTIEYNMIAGDFRFFKKIKKSVFVGAAVRFNEISNVKSGVGQLQTDKPLGYDDYWGVGFAPAINIETRDSFVYPRKGFYLEALFFIQPSFNQTSYTYQSLKFDVRKYFPVTWLSEFDALTLQFVANLNSGDVPFKDMADIGGANTMRGYYTGFYRYNNLYAFQAEYRAHVWWRLGFTVWAGAALTPVKWYTIGDNSVKPNAGIGLRLMLNKSDRLNIRVDQGFGKKDQKGFYLDIAEAY
jgi:hypothetical protein